MLWEIDLRKPARITKDHMFNTLKKEDRFMKSASMVRKSLSISLLVVTLAMLPGCSPFDWFKTQSGSDNAAVAESGEKGMPAGDQKSAKEAAMPGDVLVSMDGKPVVTKADLEEQYRQVIESQPELAKLEGCVKDSLLQGLVKQAVVDRAAKDNKLKESAEYKKDLALMYDHCEKILNLKYFRKMFESELEVTKAEVKDFYDKNKGNFNELILDHGGVETRGVSFDKKADAEAFLAKVKAAPKDFDKLAQAFPPKDVFQAFVQAHSPNVDVAIKTAVAAMKSFPKIEMVTTAANVYWVINATSRKEPQYRPLDKDIEAGLTELIKQEKEAKVMRTKMEELEKKYNVKVNHAALQSAQTQIDFEQSLGMMLDNDTQVAEADLDQTAESAANHTAHVA